MTFTKIFKQYIISVREFWISECIPRFGHSSVFHERCLGLSTEQLMGFFVANWSRLRNITNTGLAPGEQTRPAVLRTPLNPVFELKRNYINQDETELLLRYRLLYILRSASCLLPTSSSCVLFLKLRHHLVSSSLHYVTGPSWNEVNSLQAARLKLMIKKREGKFLAFAEVFHSTVTTEKFLDQCLFDFFSSNPLEIWVMTTLAVIDRRWDDTERNIWFV